VYLTLIDRSLRWTTSSVLKMHYELKAGDEIVGTLKFRSLLGTLAEAKGFDGCWTFKRVGFWQTQAKVRVCGSDTDIASFKHNTWKGGGTLTLGSNRELRATSNLWMTHIEIQEMTGECLIRLNIKGMMQSTAEVELLPSAQDLPETPWLVMFGWYLFVMMQMDMTVVGGGATAG
jgi:hypothetical protein